MTTELYNKFLKDLDESPSYVKDNVLCYFYNNTSNCTKCPKLESCNEKIKALNMLAERCKSTVKESEDDKRS